MEPKIDEANKKNVPILTWSSYSSVLSTNSSVDNHHHHHHHQQRIINEKHSAKEDEQVPFRKDTFSGEVISDNVNYLDSTNNNDTNTNNKNKKGLVGNDKVKNGDLSRNNLASDKVKFIGSSGNIKTICKDDNSEVGAGKKSKIPDGGWGWVIVFSSFLISMIADGISFSFGLLYIEFLNHFEESKSKTAWIGSLFMAVPLLTGPIMSALVDRYGCKYMTMVGGTVSAFGFVLSVFGNSIEWEYVTFGFVAGSGLGLCYVTAVVSIAYWFDKYRTLATGLGACGTGVGTFIYAPLTQYFIEEYGWRGTVLLLAGTFLNMCVCGAVMRDPEWWTSEQNKQGGLAVSKSMKNASSCGSVSEDVGSDSFKMEEIRNLLKSGRSPEYVLTALVTSIRMPPQNEINTAMMSSPAYRSAVNLPTFVKQNEKVPLEVVQQLMNNVKIYNLIFENYPSLLHSRSVSDGKMSQIPGETEIIKNGTVPMSMKVEESNDGRIENPIANEKLVKTLSREISVLPEVSLKATHKPLPTFSPRESGQHYLKYLKLHRNSVMYRGAMLNIPRYHLRASSCPNIYRNSMTTIAKENEEKWYADTLEVLKGMADFSMFLELHFLLMSLGTILLFTWFIIPYFYLAEHLTRNGYTEIEASHLLSIVGITNCIGMVALGWAGDQPWVNVTKTYSVCLLLCGLCCLLMPVTTSNYNALAVVSAFFGIFFAGNYSFTPTILVELIPLERFTTAYGLTLLCQGIGNLLGPPLAGWIFDITGSWELSFYLAGFWIIVSGLLVIVIPVTKNRKIWGSGSLEMDKISNA